MTAEIDQPDGSLPGELMMWVLIVSELLVFGAGLLAYLGVRVTDPSGFAAAQANLHRSMAGLNTALLVSSGYLAARAVEFSSQRNRRATRLALFGAVGLGLGFLGIKGVEYADEIGKGLGPDTHPFFMFYYLLTGFHAAHVVAGLGLLVMAALRDHPRTVETVAAFWHMVDLVWVLLFPIIYLM